MKLTQQNIHISLTDRKEMEEFLKTELTSNVELALFTGSHANPSKVLNNKSLLLRLKKTFKKYPVKRSIHGPFMDLQYESKDIDIRKINTKRVKDALSVAGELRADHMVVHSTFNPLMAMANPQYARIWVEESYDFWNKILPHAKRNGCMLCLENIFDKTPLMQKKIIHAINSPLFKACLDIGHAFIFGSLPMSEWIHLLRKELYHIHAHDNDGVQDQHWAIGSGAVDYKSIWTALQKIRHVPVFTVEVCTQAAAQRSLSVIKKLPIAQG